MRFTEGHKRKISQALKGKATWLSKLKEADYSKFLEFQSRVGKRGAEVNRRNKTGCYFDKNLQSNAGKIAQQKYSYNIIWKDAIKRWKERDYEGYMEHQSKAARRSLELCPDLHYDFGANYGSMGGKASANNPDNIEKRKEILTRYRATPEYRLMVMKHLENLRKNKKHYFSGIYFSSVGELEIARKILEYDLEAELVKGKNCHFIIKMGNGNFREFDFFIQDKLFIEYHPYDFTGLTTKEYYNKRRKILDEKGLADKKLVVLENIDEFDQIIGDFQ